MITRLREFLKDRLPLHDPLRDFLREPQPSNAGWLHTLGNVLLVLLALQMVTGAFLMFFYAPTPDDSWQSLKFLTENFFSGRLLRSLHVWGSSLIVIAATLHILRVVLHGAYKRPRELNWIAGLALFLVILGLAFTGYLLP